MSTVAHEVDGPVLRLTFNRAAERNSINVAMLRELNDLLDEAERRPEIVAVALAGRGEVFSAGLDFNELNAFEANSLGAKAIEGFCSVYFRTLQRLTIIPKVVVAEVDGAVLGGGVGLLAASDLVAATPSSSFALPELLWGILPAMVLPFLGRRMGAHQAYRFALTAAPMGAARATELHLVDELDTQPAMVLRRMLPRLRRIQPDGIARLKRYSHELDDINGRVAELAVTTAARALVAPATRERIRAFVVEERWPWEKENRT